ncbi:metallophosphoesterase family protein [Candidatus Korarchaeum cryptofilum]|jgi:Icc-related predicted phosphoesterase|uniref:Metallophosphoesterase n=1 Tax=Korarchaeum cryptofilum (strain OPF8) TaxID=374847 RepID=B1L523_KORCO|nr:metallophosphoesterase [Candidatus Korarchaeum cryptofilum]ACB07552.1 metallophosphoesterase [Candidatus Korarchaeum cryptofilum OPF8]
MTRILFVTDVHGSEYVFRKFLNAIPIYKADVGILLGDLAGKLLVPIVKNPDNTYVSTFFGGTYKFKEKELDDVKKRISIAGYYPIIVTKEELDEIERNPELKDRLFVENIKARLRSWIKLAEERLKGKNVKIFISAGNDDPLEIEEVLNESDFVINVGMKKVWVDEHHEMITLPYSNPTPWNTPREVPEEKLEEMIEDLVKKIENMENAIFNFHVPPYDSGLDLAPKLSKDLTPSVSEMIPVGSVAVRKAIEKYQPMMGLHGHIHESKGFCNIGRTICFNPGSEYGEGILKGVLIDIERGKVKGYSFVSG